MTESLADGGILLYDEHFLSHDDALELFAHVRTDVPWKQEQGSWGAPYPRLTALYADAGVQYTYSGVTYPSLLWLPELDAVRQRVEQVIDEEFDAERAKFNSVLLNLYRTGKDSMGWHADDEPELGPNPIVPSVSLGAERRFVLRHETTKAKREYRLTNGSLLIMAGTLQHHWKHAVPKTAKPVGERINLTFRNIVSP